MPRTCPISTPRHTLGAITQKCLVSSSTKAQHPHICSKHPRLCSHKGVLRLYPQQYLISIQLLVQPSPNGSIQDQTTPNGWYVHITANHLFFLLFLIDITSLTDKPRLVDSLIRLSNLLQLFNYLDHDHNIIDLASQYKMLLTIEKLITHWMLSSRRQTYIKTWRSLKLDFSAISLNSPFIRGGLDQIRWKNSIWSHNFFKNSTHDAEMRIERSAKHLRIRLSFDAGVRVHHLLMHCDKLWDRIKSACTNPHRYEQDFKIDENTCKQLLKTSVKLVNRKQGYFEGKI